MKTTPARDSFVARTPTESANKTSAAVGGAETVEKAEVMTSVQQRRLFACARNLSMTDQERLDFAEIILKKDIESWKDLTGEDAARLIDAFEGYEKITWMLLSRSP